MQYNGDLDLFFHGCLMMTLLSIALQVIKQDCYVTRDVRSQIEETILLPVSELAH